MPNPLHDPSKKNKQKEFFSSNESTFEMHIPHVGSNKTMKETHQEKTICYYVVVI
jgi:hypothetical protein